MALVEFNNDSTPYLNAENLNNNFNELGKYYEYNAQMLIGNSRIYFKKYGHVVEMYHNGDITSFPMGEEVEILNNIPSEYRPDHNVFFSVENSVPAKIRLILRTDGKLTARSYDVAISSANNFQFHVTYLV